MRLSLLTLLLLGLSGVMKAQQVESDTLSETAGMSYFFVVRSGVATGCTDCIARNPVALSASTIHGLTMGNRYRLGIGIGLDSYIDWQTIPFFGVGYLDFLKLDEGAFYVQMAYGYSKTLRSYQYSVENFKDGHWGLMVNPEVGYRLRKDNLNVYFFAGYKYQHVEANYDYPYYWYTIDGTLLSSGSTTTIKLDLNRITLGIGIGLR